VTLFLASGLTPGKSLTSPNLIRKVERRFVALPMAEQIGRSERLRDLLVRGALRIPKNVRHAMPGSAVPQTRIDPESTVRELENDHVLPD